jgi:hypothetical protein
VGDERDGLTDTVHHPAFRAALTRKRSKPRVAQGFRLQWWSE